MQCRNCKNRLVITQADRRIGELWCEFCHFMMEIRGEMKEKCGETHSPLDSPPRGLVIGVHGRKET